jgi:hypothetical protein
VRWVVCRSGALALKLGRMADAEDAFVTLLGFNPDHNEYHYRLHAARGWTAPAGTVSLILLQQCPFWSHAWRFICEFSSPWRLLTWRLLT